ncbi:MAG: bifunctional glutamate N-acetyltransferase/amino-acid acetyltransferase ArgJ [Deltaproteobacteria bacterium]|nr:bifunctional glutamate N-acetyltransferase/amino-acid acetyltransferase ArgJ [Deltaproteobacteria bacterium]
MSNQKQTTEIGTAGLSFVPGFSFSALGVGRDDRPNLGLIFSEHKETHGAAVFTTNEVKAAPVAVSQRHLKASDRKRAVIINAGVANAYTGPEGMKDAETCVAELACRLEVPEVEIFVASTGVIGRRFDVQAMTAAYPRLIEMRSASAGHDFARAILTTDTRTKERCVAFELNGHTIHLAACAKGAGMIMPNMATMLSCAITDAAIAPRALRSALSSAAARSFNCITIDGDTSTNDSVFLLANGAAGNPVIDLDQRSAYAAFEAHLTALMEACAIDIVRDGEGATKLITVRIEHATTVLAANAVAFSIANSPLVKTAFFGQDLNWGRLAMAVGKARTGMDPERLDVSVNGVRIATDGRVADDVTLASAQETLKQAEIDLLLDFKQGSSSTRIWTCDLSYDYVKINADYTT